MNNLMKAFGYIRIVRENTDTFRLYQESISLCNILSHEAITNLSEWAVVVVLNEKQKKRS
jgi:hypothetical protein